MTTTADPSAVLIYDPDFLDPKEPTGLWFCATAEDVRAVGINACCLAIGGRWEELNGLHDFFAQFPYVFVAASGERGKEIARELNNRISHTVVVPDEASFRGYDSVRALRDACGLDALPKLLYNARELPAVGLISIADVEPEQRSRHRSLSGIRDLDRLTGGFSGGELTVWTGRRGSGKSTLLGQLLLEAAAGRQRVCAYSGELKASQFKAWLYQQAAGPDHVEPWTDSLTGKRLYRVPPPVWSLIDDWLREELYLFDLRRQNAHDEDSILELFEYAHRRYCCTVFLVDNIMTARFKTSRDSDFYRAQSNFTGRLVEFSKRFDVHVHLVAHPRKTDKRGGKELDADDVGGTGDITNRADNVLAVSRLSELDAGQAGFQTGLTLLKNRSHGASGSFALNFDAASRRFYSPSAAPDRRYPWEQYCQQTLKEVPDSPDVPWPQKEVRP